MSEFRFRCSSADRIIQCPASVSLIENTIAIEQDTTAADWGTATHNAAAGLMNRLDGWDAGIDDEQRQIAIDYHDYLCGITYRTDWNIEAAIDCSQIHPENGGTCDAWCEVNGVLHVVDLKTGYNIVWPDCWQLMNYAAGIITSAPSLAHEIDSVVLHIFQPRAFGREGASETATFSITDVMEWVGTLRRAYNNAASDVPWRKTGSSCRYCAVRYKCGLFRKNTVDLANSVEQATYHLTDTDNLDSMAVEYEWLQKIQTILKQYVSGIEARLIYSIKQGASVPGWMLKETLGNRDWALDPEELIQLAKLENVDIGKSGVITPAQAEKKGLSKKLVSELTERKQTGVKLTACDFKFTGVK